MPRFGSLKARQRPNVKFKFSHGVVGGAYINCLMVIGGSLYNIITLPWIYTTTCSAYWIHVFEVMNDPGCLKMCAITDLCSFIDGLYLVIVGTEGLFIGHRCCCYIYA